jgi:hypothetical protein
LLRSFILFALGQGRQFAAGLDFGALPSAVVGAARHTLTLIH